jgi:hypothetical protein
MEDIIQALQTWAIENMIEVKDEGEENWEQQEKPQESR